MPKPAEETEEPKVPRGDRFERLKNGTSPFEELKHATMKYGPSKTLTGRPQASQEKAVNKNATLDAVRAAAEAEAEAEAARFDYDKIDRVSFQTATRFRAHYMSKWVHSREG